MPVFGRHQEVQPAQSAPYAAAVTETLLTHTSRVPATPERVFDHLTDPLSYVGLTPFVTAVSDVRSTEDDVRYVAVERFRLGAVPAWTNRIAVTMRGDRDALIVRQDVVSPARVRLWSVVSLGPDGDGTVVSEIITVRMPWPLAGLVRRRARAAQLYRAAELSRRASSWQTAP
jgi:hypothetical protein